MNYFIQEIIINKIYHLENFSIKLSDTEKKNLIITGKNGSGKTILLDAILEHFQHVKDRLHELLTNGEHINSLTKGLERLAKSDPNYSIYVSSLKNSKELACKFFGKVEVKFNDVVQIEQSYKEDSFVFAFYEANRASSSVMQAVQNPTKPNYEKGRNIKEKKTTEFLKFLADYKIQEALARNEGKLEDADSIKEWFDGFEQLLKTIFEDEALKLQFKYKDYSFIIVSKGRQFAFTELSDGYAAIINIVTDLIFKMQSKDSLERIYQKQGIVIIDEIETHLHLELQRLVLPMLTEIFPNIQFIITTHSPFVINSIENAVIFDLETRQTLSDLTDYSYQALAEGYFGAKTESSFIRGRMEELKELAKKENITDDEIKKRDALLKEFKEIPGIIAPQIKSEYYEIQLALQK